MELAYAASSTPPESASAAPPRLTPAGHGCSGPTSFSRLRLEQLDILGHLSGKAESLVDDDTKGLVISSKAMQRSIKAASMDKFRSDALSAMRYENRRTPGKWAIRLDPTQREPGQAALHGYKNAAVTDLAKARARASHAAPGRAPGAGRSVSRPISLPHLRELWGFCRTPRERLCIRLLVLAHALLARPGELLRLRDHNDCRSPELTDGEGQPYIQVFHVMRKTATINAPVLFSDFRPEEALSHVSDPMRAWKELSEAARGLPLAATVFPSLVRSSNPPEPLVAKARETINGILLDLATRAWGGDRARGFTLYSGRHSAGQLWEVALGTAIVGQAGWTDIVSRTGAKTDLPRRGSAASRYTEDDPRGRAVELRRARRVVEGSKGGAKPPPRPRPLRPAYSGSLPTSALSTP